MAVRCHLGSVEQIHPFTVVFSPSIVSLNMSFASNSNFGIDSNLWQNRKLPQLHIIASNEGHCQIIHRKRFNFTHIISTSYFFPLNGASFL